MITLYHYPHCPFCQRVRLFLGYKNIEYTGVTLPYSDKETPQKLCNSKTLPIIDFGEGTIINESITIIREIENRFPHPIGFLGPVEARFQWARMAITSLPHYFEILLPAFVKSYAEFTQNAKEAEFFMQKKEKAVGKSFVLIEKEMPELYNMYIKEQIEGIVDIVEDSFFVMGPTFTVADCVLAADLSGLRLLKHINLPSEIISYIKRVEARCNEKLLEDLVK